MGDHADKEHSREEAMGADEEQVAAAADLRDRANTQNANGALVVG
jgi:hypothetical protein